MRFPIVLCLVLAPLVLGACQDDAAKLAEHMSRGKAYAEGEKLQEAIIEFKSALQIDPNNADAHYQLALAYLRTQKPREGFWELRETVRLDPANHDAKLEFAQIAILAGEEEEGLKRATEVVEADPNNLLAYLVQGQAFGALERLDEALAAYRKAVEVGGDDERTHKALAKALIARDLDDEAGQVLKTLVERFPSFENHAARARYLRGIEDLDGAEAELKAGLALAEGEQRSQAYALYASFLYRQRSPEAAMAMLEQAIETEQDPVPAIYLLAQLYRNQGQPEKADAVMSRAATTRPDDPEVHLHLASYRGRNDDFEGALEAVDRALELAPDNINAKIQKAELLIELGFRKNREGAKEEARALVDSVLAESPRSPQALFGDARLKLGSGDTAGAVAALEAALDTNPNWARAHYVLGVAFAARDELTKARAELARALEIDTALLDAKHVLSQVHFRLGEWDFAVETGREYLREKPDDAAARLLVAQSLVRLGRIDEAEKELKAIPAGTRDGEVLYALGRIQQARQNYEQSRELLVQANDLLPAHADILQALLEVDRRLNRVPDSVARIKAAVEQVPDSAKLRQLAGVVEAAEGNKEEAEAAFKKAIELDPLDISGYERLARFYAATGRLDETARTYESALEVKPDAAQLHHFLGVLYELAGDRDRAIQRYEDAIRYGPELGEAKNNLAYIYADTGQNLDRALDLAKDAKALMPDNPSVSDTLGWVLFKRGVPSAAISYLKEAEAATKPTDASLGVVRYHLAQAYEANGDSADAIAALDRSLAALDAQMKQAEKPGPEPAWAAEARGMRQRLATGGAAPAEG